MSSTKPTSPFLALSTELHLAIASYPPFSEADALRLINHHFYTIPPLSSFHTKSLRDTRDGDLNYNYEAYHSLPDSARAAGMTEEQWEQWIWFEVLEGMIEYDAEESWLTCSNDLKVGKECRCLCRQARLEILVTRMKLDHKGFDEKPSLSKSCKRCVGYENFMDAGMEHCKSLERGL